MLLSPGLLLLASDDARRAAARRALRSREAAARWRRRRRRRNARCSVTAATQCTGCRALGLSTPIAADIALAAGNAGAAVVWAPPLQYAAVGVRAHGLVATDGPCASSSGENTGLRRRWSPSRRCDASSSLQRSAMRGVPTVDVVTISGPAPQASTTASRGSSAMS